jgi:putative FmdB family regulatory protein
MPTYEYVCEHRDCGHEWEKQQSIKEEPERQCPKCGRGSAKRLISCGSFVLKGRGWASDLYGNER